ncbi:glycoside hydrolase superfamily [Crucibulum laeve]|uniref:glucan endo-1,3-beta-D-glucosidase n=1 Tax=Crucibulum laeve TaxID=68775 RepID=A0A5C3LJA6_9AGAR|nr:glycoside hydrolase superfamily [Crucibulum laeve]
MSRPYTDNPFNPSSTADLQDYYDSVPPAHRLSGASQSSYPLSGQAQNPGHQGIPLVAPTSYNPMASSGYTHQPLATHSTQDLHAPETRQYGDNGFGRSTGYTPSPWLESEQRKSKRSRWIFVAAIVGLILIIIIAVVVGVVVSHNKKGSGSSSSSPSSSSGGSKGNTSTNLGDPSNFAKDSNLHRSFYGLAYTPEGSQLPDCGNTLENVIQDIQVMSQLTNRIRLYGADCNQSALVLEAIKQTKVDMTVWLGNFIVATDNNAAYLRQRDVIKDAIQTYGTDHIGGITVGNEYMLNYLTDNGGASTPPDSSVGNTGAQLLISDIKDTRDMLAGMSLSKTLPVGTADAGSYFNTQVLEAVDYGMANVHPWFANVSASDAAGWTANFFSETNVAPAKALSNNPQMYIAETGWPTKSSDAGNANNGASTASEANLQTFIDTFVCQANTNGTGYFFFEFFDEEWKDKQFGGVEGWWGLFNADRSLKNIKIPDCAAP